MNTYMDVRAMTVTIGDWIREEGGQEFRQVRSIHTGMNGQITFRVKEETGVRPINTRTFATVQLQLVRV